MSNPVLDAARAKRASQQSKLDAILAGAEAETRSLTDEEVSDFEARVNKIKALDGQIELLEAEEARKATALEASKPVLGDQVHVVSDARTYSKHGEHSYIKDLIAVQVPQSSFDGSEARERLIAHAREVEVDAQRDAGEAKRLAFARGEKRAISTTNGSGGELVPPLWLMNVVPVFRAGRVFADRVQHFDLPPGTDIINIPKLSTGTTVAAQASQGSGVSSVDIVTTSASASVFTYAGQQDLSLQLIEQSPLNVDGVVSTDLHADYDRALDSDIIAGPGSGGRHTGVLNTSSVNTVTASSATFFGTSGGHVPSIASAINKIETNRYAPPTAIWVHPRRSNWWSIQADGNTRPLFVAPMGAPYNAIGINENSPITQGVAGEILGVPVIKDANMPTTMNSTTVGGGTADPIVVLKEDDLYLWEGPLRFRVLPEVLSGTLQVRVQLYAYSAFMANRAPVAISVVTGNTGLAAPTF